MHKKLKLIFLLIILPSFQSHGQINELSLMGIDTDDFTQAYKPETDDTFRESEKPKKEINEETQREKFKDSNYGYSGGESFNNPPRSNLSEEALEYFGYSYFLNGPDAFSSEAKSVFATPPQRECYFRRAILEQFCNDFARGDFDPHAALRSCYKFHYSGLGGP